jgi:6-hydroxynicotinate 3-monooxygenase
MNSTKGCVQTRTRRGQSLLATTGEMDKKTRIAVVGAGIGGLTAAGFLQRGGFDVTLYEQARAFSRLGAGITLGANVTKPLRRLGIEDALVTAGIKPHSYVSRTWDSGEIVYQLVFDANTENRFGGPYLGIHRGDLHAVLAQGTAPETLAFDHRLIQLEETDSSVRLVFDNGRIAEADIVIGADGIHSKIREYLLGTEPLRFIGAAAYRSIFPTQRLNGFAIPDCTKWWGPDRHILPYFMRSKRDEVYVIGVVPRRTWETDEASIQSSRDEFMALFDGFHPDLVRVLQVTDDVSVWPIFDRERNDRWSGGRIVLLGDACHPMRPFMGAGGAMAVEDAVILSRCLSECASAAEAFRSYENTRIPRVAETQRISIENTWMGGPTETDWYYCYDACTAPLAKP